MVLNGKKLPCWLDSMWEDAQVRATKYLKNCSEDYKQLKAEKQMITEAYPELQMIIEGDDVGTEVVLDNEKIKKLSELVGLVSDILWLYQKLFYGIGFYDGVKLAEVMKKLDEIY